MSVRMASYVSGDSILHRLHPMTKLLGAVLVCVAAFLFESWPTPAALALFLVILHAPRDVGFGRLAAAVRPLPLFVAIIVLANIFLVRRPGPWQESAGAGLVQSLRVVVLVVTGSLFVATTDAIDLSDSTLRLLGPLRRVGLPVGELSLMSMIAVSFVPLIAEETKRLELARAVRCGFPGRGLSAIRAAVPLLAPLVLGVFRRSGEIDDALKARCYQLDAPRTSFRRARFGRLDRAVCAGAVVVFLAGLYAKF